jgi:hypothetical protein
MKKNQLVAKIARWTQRRHLLLLLLVITQLLK